MAMRSIEKVSGLRCQVSAKSQWPKANGRIMIPHSYHSTRYNGFSPRDQLGLPIFCAAGNRERRLMAASFAFATRSGLDWKLPRLGPVTGGIRHPHTWVLHPRVFNLLPASSTAPRLG